MVGKKFMIPHTRIATPKHTNLLLNTNIKIDIRSIG